MAMTAKHRNFGGVNGYALENFIEFLTGKRPFESSYNETTKKLEMYVSDSILSDDEGNEKMRALMTAFEKRYNCEIKKISSL